MHRAAACLALLLATAAPAQDRIPPAPAEPFSEEVFGHRIDDSYRWMEAPENAERMRGWLGQAGSVTRARLAALPERARFVALLEEATRAGIFYSRAQSAGGRLFYLRQDPGARVAKLVVRDPGQSERVLVDPVEGTAATRAIASFTPSPDGRTVAVLIGEGGAELGQFRLLDVATGAERHRLEGQTFGDFELTWLAPDLVTYTRATQGLEPGGDPLINTQAMVVALTPEGVTERVGLGTRLEGGPAFEPQEFPAILGHPGDPIVLGFSFGARADARAWVSTPERIRSGRAEWVPLAGFEDQLASAHAFGNWVYWISTKDASNGALYRRRFADGRLGETETVLAAGDLILSQVSATSDGVYVTGHRDGASHLLYLTGGSGAPREIALPFESELVSPEVDTDGRSILFGLQGWTQTRQSFRVTGDRIESLGLDSASWSPVAAFRTQREEAVSSDGTRVPMVIVSRPGATGPVPTIVEGYGSYGILTTSPFASPFYTPWTARGGAMVYCGTRGGGERGRAWHEGGRGANKPAAQEDLAACARRVQEVGMATPATTVLWGGSAAGLLVPGAAMRHPELFTALIPRVAVLNATRLGAAPNGPNQFGEMGDPRERAGYEGLRVQDAYLALLEARDVPDTLVTIGLNDTRVVPWMGAKFAARELARFGDRRQVLVRVDADQGHGIGSARDAQIAEFADIYAWAWAQATGE